MLQLLKSYIGYGALVSFVVSGFVINIVQMIMFCLLRPFSKPLYITVNHYLQYSSWSQPVAIADWFSNLKCRIYFANEESAQTFCQRSCIVIGNHRYDIDWLAAWMLSEKLGSLGGDKAVMKSSLRYVPIIGWGWTLGDMIFLSRDWKKDQKNLVNYMKVLLKYPRSPLLIYSEGTRFTKAKHDASIKFAEEKGLDIKLKHHLVPRTRGFNCMMKIVQDEKAQDPKLVYDLFDMQVAIENDDNSSATLAAVLAGKESCVHIYVEKLSPETVDFHNEEAASKYLFDIFRNKDRIHEHFLKNGKFPGIEIEYKPRLQSLLNIYAWLISTNSLLIYFYYVCYTSGGMLSMIIATMLGISALIAIRILIHSTQVSKSSSYGTRNSKLETKQS